jgi:hypothetical protein
MPDLRERDNRLEGDDCRHDARRIPLLGMTSRPERVAIGADVPVRGDLHPPCLACTKAIPRENDGA